MIGMDFEWDERKRARLIEERALDLASAYLFFDGRPAIQQPTPRDNEERWKTTGRDRGDILDRHLDVARGSHSRDFDEASA
jgi:uncharacterized DUF497 family protein